VTKKPGAGRSRQNAFIILLLVALLALVAGGAWRPAEAANPPRQAAQSADGDGIHHGGCLPSDPTGFEQMSVPGSGMPLGASVNLASQIPPIGNQGTLNSCVGWSISYTYKSWSEKIKHPTNNLNDPTYEFSPSFVWNQLNGGYNQGISMSSAFTLLQNEGDISLRSMPYVDGDYTTQPTAAQLNAALPYRISSDWRYLWVRSRYDAPFSPANDINAVKTLLASGKMLVMAIPLYDDLPGFNGNPAAPYYSYDGYSSWEGGHAVSIVGYNDNINPGGGSADLKGGFLMANSWGSTWNGSSHGYIYLSYDFVKRYVTEAWVMNDTGQDTSVWYLAEGTTAWGFNCSLGIMNPNSTQVTVKVTYMTDSGQVDGGTYKVSAMSSGYLYPVDILGEKDFSTKVECVEKKPIAVDRNMFFTPTSGGGSARGAPTLKSSDGQPGVVERSMSSRKPKSGGDRWANIFEGHASVGVNAAATEWYLPEGSSEWGFTCWLLIQNPGGSTATCNVTYMTASDGPKTVTHTIPARSRKSFNMADEIGNKDASIQVKSNVPVIPERAMYKNDRREGHDSIGTTAPALDYYLAEGTTAWGFTTYVLVQNPQSTPNNVDITYMTPSGPMKQPTFTMPANSRTTIRVNDIGGVTNTDLSTRVHGSKPLIAERAMYWVGGEQYLAQVCHDSIGMAEPHKYFFMPSGSTVSEYDAETYTLVQNLNSSSVNIRVTYVTGSGSGNKSFDTTIPAQSRKTFNMADMVPEGNYGIIVESLSSGKKIMVERAIYFIGKGCGTDTIGGYSD
jgi:hypothetical protein